MKRLVFLLEEMSTQKFLMNFLPELGFRKEEYLFPKIYQGKQDLLENFIRELRGWGVPGIRFIMLVDKDGDECRELKARILAKAEKKCRKQFEQLRVRILCRELEAWYLGDLAALRSVYPGNWKLQEPRNPDEVENPKPSRFLENKIPDFDKREIPATMGEILGRKCAEDTGEGFGGNHSPSFRCFVRTMREELEKLREGQGGV